ncbi:hypothetical protein NUSPORA_02093 [Nucleospora cyclopteri]
MFYIFQKTSEPDQKELEPEKPKFVVKKEELKIIKGIVQTKKSIFESLREEQPVIHENNPYKNKEIILLPRNFYQNLEIFKQKIQELETIFISNQVPYKKMPKDVQNLNYKLLKLKKLHSLLTNTVEKEIFILNLEQIINDFNNFVDNGLIFIKV